MHIYKNMLVSSVVALVLPSVSVNKNTPPKSLTCGKTSSQSTNSGAGEQFPLLPCRALA